MKNLRFMHIHTAEPIVSMDLKFWTRTADMPEGKLPSEDPSGSPEIKGKKNKNKRKTKIKSKM